MESAKKEREVDWKAEVVEDSSGSESEEEEEELVLVELHGVIDSEIFTQDNFNKFKMIGVETARPVLQVENFMFSGQYDHTMGTAVLLEEEEERRLLSDPVFSKRPPRSLRYVCKTPKKLSMKRVFVSEKTAGGSAAEGGVGKEETQEEEETGVSVKPVVCAAAPVD